MPVAPHLSKAEREAVAAAARIAASGVKVTWRNVGRRVDYIVDGRPHKVFTSGTDSVHAELVRQVSEAYVAELEIAHAEAKRAPKKETQGHEAGSVSLREETPVRCESAEPDFGQGSAVLSRPEGRDVDEVRGRVDGASRPEPSRSTRRTGKAAERGVRKPASEREASI